MPTRSILSTTTLLVAILASAGCLTTPEDDAPRRTPLEWQPGTWWEYELSGELPAPWMQARLHDLGEQHPPAIPTWKLGQTTTFVAVPEGENHWDGTVFADDPIAEYLAVHGLPLATTWYTHIGTSIGILHERYNMVNSSVQGTQFFSFPLHDGKTWTTSFLGQALTMTATSHETGFLIHARAEDKALLRYTYDPQAEWFSSYEVLDGEENVLFTATLLDHGTDPVDRPILYHNEEGSHAVTCGATQTPIPAHIARCPLDGMGFQTQPAGHNIFFKTLGYASPGPGSFQLTWIRPGWDPEVLYTAVCPCDEQVTWIFPFTDTGVHTWEMTGLTSGDERWSYLTIYYACQDTFQLKGGDLQLIGGCENSNE